MTAMMIAPPLRPSSGAGDATRLARCGTADDTRTPRVLASGAYLGTSAGLPVVGIHACDGRRVAVVTDPDTGEAVGVLAGAPTYPALRAACAQWLDTMPALVPAEEADR